MSAAAVMAAAAPTPTQPVPEESADAADPSPQPQDATGYTMEDVQRPVAKLWLDLLGFILPAPALFWGYSVSYRKTHRLSL